MGHDQKKRQLKKKIRISYSRVIIYFPVDHLLSENKNFILKIGLALCLMAKPIIFVN